MTHSQKPSRMPGSNSKLALGRGLAITVVALLVALRAAQATPSVPSKGWEFVRWGMNPMQLRSASHGAVSAGSAGYDFLRREYSMDKFKFNVVFDYVPPQNDPGNNNLDTLELNAVLLNLRLESGSCAELATYLKSIYGKPDQAFASGPVGILWHKREFGNDIQYYTWNERKGCSVMYMPLGASNR